MQTEIQEKQYVSWLVTFWMLQPKAKAALQNVPGDVSLASSPYISLSASNTAWQI